MFCDQGKQQKGKWWLKLDNEKSQRKKWGFMSGNIVNLLLDLNKKPVEGFSAGLIDDNDLFKWEVMIIGPSDSYQYVVYNLFLLINAISSEGIF